MNAEINDAIPSQRPLFLVFAGLLSLLVLSAISSHFLTGTFGTAMALTIAAAKLALIFTYFMRLREQPGLVKLFALAGFFWLGLLLLFTFTDYLSRG